MFRRWRLDLVIANSYSFKLQILHILVKFNTFWDIIRCVGTGAQYFVAKILNSFSLRTWDLQFRQIAAVAIDDVESLTACSTIDTLRKVKSDFEWDPVDIWQKLEFIPMPNFAQKRVWCVYRTLAYPGQTLDKPVQVGNPPNELTSSRLEGDNSRSAI